MQFSFATLNQIFQNGLIDLSISIDLIFYSSTNTNLKMANLPEIKYKTATRTNYSTYTIILLYFLDLII